MESTHAISLSVRSRTPIRVAPIEYWMIYTHLGTFIAYTSSDRWNVTFNMLLISLMDDTQPYRAEVRDRSVHSNFSYLYRSITVNLMMFLLTIYQTYSKGL